MAAKFSGGTATDGVVAYQDDADPNQFHYLPANIDCVLGENLQDFEVRYWGIGPAFYVRIDDRWVSSVGAVLSGRAALDISESQRAAIKSEITRVYGIPDPRIIPLVLSEVQVTPVLAEKTLGLGEGSDVNFPSTVNFGSAFNYVVGTGNNLFGQFVANDTAGGIVTTSPSFGINMQGLAEFVGDPWTVTVTANLSQVWSYVREKAAAGVSIGWLNLGRADYSRIMMDMARDQVIQLEFREGSLDNELYGRQILEMGKSMFEALNQRAGAGEGFFKFEPNPTPEPSQNPNSGFSWPWKPSINLEFGQQVLESAQSMTYSETISYTGRLNWMVPSSMTLAVACGLPTHNLFHDLGNPDVPCITTEKLEALAARIEQEKAEKKEILDLLSALLREDAITSREFFEQVRELDLFSAGEDSLVVQDHEGREAMVIGYTPNAVRRRLNIASR